MAFFELQECKEKKPWEREVQEENGRQCFHEYNSKIVQDEKQSLDPVCSISPSPSQPDRSALFL